METSRHLGLICHLFRDVINFWTGTMEKEEVLLRKRYMELSNLAYQRGIPMYTDFLNLNELNILHTTPKELLPVSYSTFGGYEFSERQMAAFLPDAFSACVDYPFEIIKFRPVHLKFAEELTHRDYLGALMNLGIERSKLGDIIIQNGEAFLFAHRALAPYITENLGKVRHTIVVAEIIDGIHFSYEPQFEEIKGTVASVRLDALLSIAFNTSRSKLTALIEAGRVFVNGKLVTSNGYRLKEDDIISVRQMGRFRYKGILSETKKGRCYVMIHKYI